MRLNRNKLWILRQALLALILSLPYVLKAQGTNEVVIHPGAQIYAHPNSFTNIFSDLTNSGSFTSVNSPVGGVINFYARIWRNESGSVFPDESATGVDGVGGVFRFSDEINKQGQRIITPGSQPFNGFPNLRIDNLSNVTVEGGNLHVQNTLDFVNGKLILSNVDINVGRNGLGTISGYGRNTYVVTGIGFTGGSLVRSFTGTATTPIDFPVGTSTSSYTPAALTYTGIPQTIKVRVADNVYNKLNFSEYLTKTWIVAREQTDAAGTIALTLQHNGADEGMKYFQNRNDAYVTRYDPKLVGLYDILPPMATTSPGTISTRGPVASSYMNSRLNIGVLKAVEYFTKSVIKTQVDENTPINIPDAISPNGDGMNDTYIVVKRLPTDKVRFEVFTRNQVPVYQNLDYDNSFDGTGNLGGFMGNVLPDGIYYYLISVNGAKGIPGYLILIR